jgi:streptomycin 6-kinase
LGPHFGLSFNYVAPATQADGREVVLKVGVPRQELNTEIAALQLYAGRGSVRLLDADPALGALLLERIQPGEMLSGLAERDDEAATRIAAEVMAQLWRPVPAEHSFPNVADWAADLADLRPHFDGGTGPFPPHLVDLAEQLFADLLPSQAAPVVLHGDLHHYNILSGSQGSWLAIDPKGIVGEPAYETGALLRNPSPQVFGWPNVAQLYARRVAVLAEVLGLERQRIAAWGVAQGVLACWWSCEDTGDGWQDELPWVEHLIPLL